VEPSREQLTEALGRVIDPELKRPITELDMVREVRVERGHVAVTIALTVAGCPLRHAFESQVREQLLPLAGVEEVSLDFDVMSPDERAALTTKLRGGITQRSKGISLDASTRVLAVASGKGGVGKSTLTANLAAAFERLGHRTGILDADVYGHSIPHMLGVHQKPVLVDRMIVKNLLRREPDPTDGRVALATLTEEGLRMVRLAARTHLRGIRQHFSGRLSDPQLRAVASALETIVGPHTPH